MIRIWLTVLFVCWFSAKEGSAAEFPPQLRRAWSEMLTLQFDSMYRITSQQPGLAAAAYTESYGDFLRAFISEEPQDFNRLKARMDGRLEKVDALPSHSPWKKMMRGEMLLQLAVVKLKWKEYLTAAWYFRKSFQLLEENKTRFPEFIPNQKALGFFHAAIGTVPENYKWLSNLIGLHGTVQQGLSELTQVTDKLKTSRDYAFLMDEAILMRALAQGLFGKDYTAALQTLSDPQFGSTGKGALHCFILANSYQARHQPQQAIEVLNQFTPERGAYPLHYLSYMKGNLLLNQLDFTAEKHLLKYVGEYKGNSFVRSAWHKLAWIELLKGDTEGYESRMKMIIRSGSDFTDEDKQAMKEARSGEIPDVVLLRSRLLFDGGLYARALEEITSRPGTYWQRIRDQVEVTYRLGRIYDHLNQQEKAIVYYRKTYESWKEKPWYYASNAALHLGLIYENQGHPAKAREWFRKTLALRNHEYQDSIDQKAEAGLERVGRR